MTVSDRERKTGRMINIDDPAVLSVTCSKDEFEQLAAEHGFIGVDFEGRTEWLQTHGYEVTRQNMRNSDLQPSTTA